MAVVVRTLVIVIVLLIIAVSVNKPLLGKRNHIGRHAHGSPNQGEGSGFRCWIAGQRLGQKECPIHRHR